MEGTKIQLSGRHFLLTLGISVLCFGVYTTEAYVVKDTSIYYGPEITVLPYGGTSGSPYTFHFVKEVIVTYSSQSLESITFTNENNEILKLGGGYTRPVTKKTFTLDLPNEYITGIAGVIGVQNRHTVVKSITFYTSKRVLGPFGPTVGTPFSFRTTGGIITGFHGISGWLVDSFGPYVKVYCKAGDGFSAVESS